MLLIPLLLLQPPLDIERLFETHARRTVSAVSVEMVSLAPGEGTRFSYDVYYRAPDRFRIDFRPPARIPMRPERYTVVGDGTYTTVYEATSNRYARRRYSPDLGVVSNATSMLPRADPLMAAYLQPRNGLRNFLDLFGKLEYERVAEGVYRAEVHSEVGGAAAIVVAADSLTGELREVRLEVAGGYGAAWRVRHLPIDLDQALSFTPPPGATLVANLAVDHHAPTMAEDETRQIVERSRKAYDDLQTIAFTSQGFLFGAAGDQRRLANGWWERGGRMRFAVTVDRPEKSFAILYDGQNLTGWNRVARTVHRGPVSRNRFFETASRLGAEFEPLVLALSRGDNFWNHLLASDGHLAVLPDPASVKGVACRAVEARFTAGAIAVLYVREDNGLVARVDRRMEIDGRVAASESVFYDISIVNAPIPESAWDLRLPAGIAVQPIGRQ